jgi:hypothetical protein
LNEEILFFQRQQEKLTIKSPFAGVITAPRLKERTGQYLREGDLICTVEDYSTVEVEITVDEQDLPLVQPGSRVDMKVRALPFHTFEAEVVRIAPVARAEGLIDPTRPPPPSVGLKPNTVVVYCRVNDKDLRPGMTGHARISCGRRNLGDLALEYAVRLFRTEYWLW